MRKLTSVAIVLMAAALWAAAPLPAQKEAQGDAWWTGPILAPSAGNLPKGHLLFEPYFYDVAATGSRTYGNLSYLLYGLTDRVTVGLMPAFGYMEPTHGLPSRHLQVGDLGVVGQIGLRRYHPGHWFPALALNLQETLPTGRHDHLGERPADGIGSGTYTTTISLYSQTYFWLPNGRILRARLNVSEAISGIARVNGVSVYGTAAEFSGRARPGAINTTDLGLEYSLTRNWVLALDAASRYQMRTPIAGRSPAPIRLDQGASEQVIFAPAAEYNFNANLGVIAGARLIEIGRNITRSITPLVAINYMR